MSAYQTIVTTLKKVLPAKKVFQLGFNLSPMYRRSTGRLTKVSDDLKEVQVKIPLNWKNSNYVGSIFGGSMFSATDPIYMLQLFELLGKDYVVWDKAGSIRFKRPARETIYATFSFTDDEINQIKKDVLIQNEVDIVKQLNLVNKDGKVIAEIERIIYIADKDFYREKRKRRK